ncbi:hypothetical protein ID866_8644 [Astraeus odoratus]|nr:hypothetical protein ID866_8644 [Astraeus odoratus]
MIRLCSEHPFKPHCPIKTIQKDLEWWADKLQSGQVSVPIQQPPQFVNILAYLDASSGMGIAIIISNDGKHGNCSQDGSLLMEQPGTSAGQKLWALNCWYTLLTSSSAAPPTSLPSETTPVLLKVGKTTGTETTKPTKYSNMYTPSSFKPIALLECNPSMSQASTTQWMVLPEEYTPHMHSSF